MATIDTQGATGVPARNNNRIALGSGVSMVEAFGGLATIVLAIIGLAGVDPRFLAAVACVVFGVSLLCEGIALMARLANSWREIGAAEHVRDSQLGGGTSAEFLGGAAGIVLGILALIGVFPWILLSISVLVYGTAMLLGAGAGLRMGTFQLRGIREESQRHMAGELVTAARTTQAFVGLAALVLGILAITGIAAPVLTLIGFICLGAAIIAAGSTVTGKLVPHIR